MDMQTEQLSRYMQQLKLYMMIQLNLVEERDALNLPRKTLERDTPIVEWPNGHHPNIEGYIVETM